jgi:hypothetical protein
MNPINKSERTHGFCIRLKVTKNETDMNKWTIKISFVPYKVTNGARRVWFYEVNTEYKLHADYETVLEH